MTRRRQSRQSLVTPIDWKPQRPAFGKCPFAEASRQSLVTPIDWKQASRQVHGGQLERSPILGDAY